MTSLLEPSIAASYIEEIELIKVNSAAGNMTGYGGNLDLTYYYDETITDHPKNKRFAVPVLGDSRAGNAYLASDCQYTSDTNLRGIYYSNGIDGSGLSWGHGDHLYFLDVRINPESPVTVQHDLFNSTCANTMDLTISAVPSDAILVPALLNGYASRWNDPGYYSDIEKIYLLNTTTVRVICTMANMGGDAIWSSQIIIPNGAW